MNDASDPYTVQIHRHILREQNALVALADFRELFEAFRRHVRRWDIPIDELSYVMARQALGGLALQLACRPHQESLAYTFNIHRPPLNVFVAGRASEGTVVGRVFLDGVETADGSRLFVQSVRAQSGDTSQSAVAVHGLDLLVMYEQYFAQSVQLPTRFFELENDEMIMVQGLPQVDVAWIEALDPQSSLALVQGRQSLIESRHFVFRCGCTADRLAEALVGMWGEKPQELFQGEAGVEISCPRCGGRWWMDRERFEAERQRRKNSPPAA